MALDLITLLGEPALPGARLDEPRDCLRRGLAAATSATVQLCDAGIQNAPSAGYLLLYVRVDVASAYLTNKQLRRSFFVDACERAPNLLASLEAHRPAGAIAIDDYMQGWYDSRERQGSMRLYGLRTLADSLGLKYFDGELFTSENYVPIYTMKPLPVFLPPYLQAYDDYLGVDETQDAFPG